MAKFTYLGCDEPADPNGTLAFGIYFPVGEAVDVPDDRAHAIGKLSNHPHFSADGESAAKREPDPLDHDGDGKKGGAKPGKKAKG